LLPISETEFITTSDNTRYTFVRDAAGHIESVQVRFGEGSLTAPRLAKDVLLPFEMLIAGRVNEAVEAYRKIRREHPNDAGASEEHINNIGYGLLQQKKVAEAIAVFKLNVELYPQSWNVYDSLGEAYMVNGEKELAISNYKKSLALNPGNANGVAMLKKLQQ